MSEEITDECIELVKLCLDFNFCQFEGKCYKLGEGLLMRSPFSSLMAGMFMSMLESEVLVTIRTFVILFRGDVMLTICCVYGRAAK